MAVAIGAGVLVLTACGTSDEDATKAEVAQLRIPEGYVAVGSPEPASGVTYDNYMRRTYEAPPGVDICFDMEKVLEHWSGERVKRYERATGCQLVASGPGESKARMNATPDESRQFTIAFSS